MLRRYLQLTLLGLLILVPTLDIMIQPEVTAKQTARSLVYLEQTQLPIPPKPFTHDGCTLFPDRLLGHDFTEACLAHDIAYWAGGSDWYRSEADLALATAVSETGPLGLVISPFFYLAVRTFGDTWPIRQLNAHWGYGH